MLSPKRVKFRKQQRGRMRGVATRGNTIAFGQFALQAQECGWITSRQIEASRRAMTRYVKRGGKIWIRIFPDKPVTMRAAETRMGSGKGNPEFWVAFTGTHPGFGSTHGDRLVGEDPDPDFSATLDVAGHGTTAGLDLARGDPATFLCLQRELSEGNGVAPGGDAAHAASLLLTEFDAFWTQHGSGLLFNPRLSGLRTVGADGWPGAGGQHPPAWAEPVRSALRP